MEELNTTEALEIFPDYGFDTLTVADHGEALVLSQIAEDEGDDVHTLVISAKQARALYELLGRYL